MEEEDIFKEIIKKIQEMEFEERKGETPININKLDEETKKKILEDYNKLSNIPGMVEFTKKIEKEFFEGCSKDFPDVEDYINESKAGNTNILIRPLTVLSSHFRFAHILSEKLRRLIAPPNDHIQTNLPFTQRHILNKANKIFLECYSLIQIGSASGAMARWRTLYQFSVISKFLMLYPETVNEYMKSTHVDYHKYAIKFEEYNKMINVSYPEKWLDEIKYNYSQLEKDEKREYAWARSVFEQKKDINDSDKKISINLTELAKEVNLHFLLPFVSEANFYNHTNFYYLIDERGRKNSWDENDKKEYMLSPFDADIPMLLMATSLDHVIRSVCYSFIDTFPENMKIHIELKQEMVISGDYVKLLTKELTDLNSEEQIEKNLSIINSAKNKNE